ncbi:glycosyl transferase family group 2-domain-containing protein [Mycena floridula]|nr:glycosyl transferase family group 2-domain-containing protein [Mycena floridula]
MDYDNYDAVLHHVWAHTQGEAWFKPSEENISAGVCLRIKPGHFRVFPYENPFLLPFQASVRALNPLVAVKVRTAAVNAALLTVNDDATSIYIDTETRIQILDTMNHLSRADKEQCGAFVRDERVLVIWSDNLDTIIPLHTDFEQKLMKLVWRHRRAIGAASFITSTTTTSVSPSTTASDVNLAEKPKHASLSASEAVAALAREGLVEVNDPPASEPKSTSKWTWRLSKRPQGSRDLEKGSEPGAARPMRMFAPVYSGFAAAMSIYFLAQGISTILQEWRLDHDYRRIGLLATAPFLLCVSLFFAIQIISSLSFIFGPVSQYNENSRYYSAVRPESDLAIDSRLPHVTIELPVYKEGLEEVITPSVFSIKKAMQTYARQGGTSAIFVHDDGLQVISEEERSKRIAFYADHNIGWVARPPHSTKPDGFFRAGRFKKASNMNYGLRLSLKLEAKLRELESSERKGLVFEDRQSLEDMALDMAIQEMYEESGRKHLPWASNGKSIRLGEIILLVDADTIVPEDCFRDAARELAECPEVAIIQHESDVMQVAHHYFENGIAHFTRRINKAISMGCANGEVAPFVGHNAFLRWSAIQDAAFVDPADNLTKLWSEVNVSEDFDMALRLQLKGYIIRWATYSDGGFKEGVSLTADDELNRWQKYAYGCSELIFNPFVKWWRLGPITKQLRVFIWSDAPVHYKISMMSYMFSYYGIAGSATLAILNYLLLGWALDVDGYYMHSFEIWLACVVVFPGLGNIGYTLLEYRLGRKSMFASMVENITWVPFFFFFFGGLSAHLIVAILAHLFSYNITWGATAKEVERSNFFIEVPRIWKRFWPIMTLSFICIAAMIVLSLPLVPDAWRIPGESWAVILPLALVSACHILFPIVLNPWLMIFSF